MALDLAGHRGDGLTLLRELARLHPPARILVISDREDGPTVQRFFRAGALACISRQDEPAEVIVGLQRLRTNTRYAGTRIARGLLEDFAGGRMRAPTDALEDLSDREREIFRRIGAGLGASALARELDVSVKTIETYRERIKQKLGLQSGAELGRYSAAWVQQPPCGLKPSPNQPRRSRHSAVC